MSHVDDDVCFNGPKGNVWKWMLSTKQTEGLLWALHYHRKSMHFMPKNVGLISACRALVKHGLVDAKNGVKDMDTGREGWGIKLVDAAVPFAEHVEAREKKRDGGCVIE